VETENGDPAALRAKYDVGRVVGEGNFAVVKECQDRCVRDQGHLLVCDESQILLTFFPLIFFYLKKTAFWSIPSGIGRETAELQFNVN
jgi:hypothetical protein